MFLVVVERYLRRVGSSWWGRILADHDTTWTELQGALAALVCGIQLGLPWVTFLGYSFQILSILPEDVWAGILIVMGTIHLIAIRSGNIRFRSTMCLMSFLYWFTTALSFLLSNWASIGAMAFLMLGLWQMICAIRLRMVVHAVA